MLGAFSPTLLWDESVGGAARYPKDDKLVKVIINSYHVNRRGV